MVTATNTMAIITQVEMTELVTGTPKRRKTSLATIRSIMSMYNLPTADVADYQSTLRRSVSYSLFALSSL
jgi:hypothetical protein